MFGNVTLITGDALKLPFPDNSIDLIIAHPPYFGVDTARYGGKPSDQINSTTSKKMLRMLEKFTSQAHRILKPGGSLFIANGPGDEVNLKYIIDTKETSELIHLGFIIQNGYDEKNPEHVASEALNSSCVIRWDHFAKTGDDIKFNPFKVKKYNNPVWNLSVNNEESPIDQWLWDRFPTSMPDSINETLVSRLVEMFSNPGDIVLDPFGGTGVVATVSSMLGRNAISNDISPDAIEAARLRYILTVGEKHFIDKVKVISNE